MRITSQVEQLLKVANNHQLSVDSPEVHAFKQAVKWELCNDQGRRCARKLVTEGVKRLGLPEQEMSTTKARLKRCLPLAAPSLQPADTVQLATSTEILHEMRQISAKVDGVDSKLRGILSATKRAESFSLSAACHAASNGASFL